VALSAPWAPNQSLDRVLADGHAATIVDFIYTRCTTVCLSLGNTFQQLQTAIVSADPATVNPPVRLLSISFDLAHDDTRTLQQYAARLHADPRVWRFAGPRNAHDLAQLLKPYEVVVIPDGLGGFEHNAALLVVDPMGRLVRIFDYAEADLALAYARSIAAGSTAR
jgi:protein SCO1/2